MKRFTGIFLMLMVCGLGTLSAQTYQSLKDTLWCCRYFQQLNGDYYSVGNRQGYSGMTPPSNEKVVTCYYTKIPKGHCRADLYLTCKYGKTGRVDIKVINPNTNDTLWANSLSATYSYSGESRVEAFPDIDFPQDCFYRIELTFAKPTSNVSAVSRFLFEHESTLRVASPSIFMAPSTHLYTFGTTDPDAPDGEAYDWMYGEVLFPSQYHRINSYVMTLGLLAGYSGISTVGETKRHGMLFSQWDNGDTEHDMYLPSYLRSTGLDCGEDWKMQGFGGEGTGVQTVTLGDSPWRNDEWVQFVANCRPEDVEFWIEDRFGNDSVKVTSHNTLVSLWWKQPSDTEWKYISTLRAAGRNMYFSGWYSFVENYTDNGGDLYRRAYFRNGFMRSLGSGKWYNRNVCGFGHTDGGSSRGSRFDYGHGRTSLYDNCFYLSTGGFKAAPDDSSGYVTLTDNHTCVDTINLEALTKRFQTAIQKGKIVEINTAIESTREHLPQSSWKVIAYSDQEEEGEGDNGRAAFVVDGTEGTYWHTRYKSGTRLYKHTLDLYAVVPAKISSIIFSQSRDSGYRVKTINLYTSEDGKSWTLYKEGLGVPDASSATVEFEPVTTQYLRIGFEEGYGSNLVINELYLRADFNIEKVKTLVEEFINNPGELDSYKAEDLKALTTLYDNGNCTDIDAMFSALRQLAANCNPMQYNTIASLDHTGTRRAYVLRSTTGQGTLCVENTNGTPRLTLRNATADGAQSDYKQRMPASDMMNNWSFVRNDHFKSLYIYNIGSGMYLDPSNAETHLSAKPVNIAYTTSANSSFGFGLDSRQIINVDASKDAPVVTGSRGASYLFKILDNQLCTPSENWADSLRDEAEIYDKFEHYKKKLPEMLAMPEGFVGSLTNAEQKAELLELYADGKVTNDHAREFVALVEGLDRIEFDPEHVLYRIAAVNPDADKPSYLTMDADGIYTRVADQKADQLWYMKPVADGNGLQSQGLYINHLNEKAGSAITKTEGSAPDNFQFTTDSLTNYYITNVKYSRYYIGTDNSPVKVTRGESVAKWNLEPCEDLVVNLNSGGVLSAYYDFDVLIPEGLEVYVVEGIQGDQVQLWKIDSLLPARTPAILRGTAYGSYTFKAIAHQSEAYESPLLQGTFLKKSGLQSKSVYTIAVKSGKPCLAQYAGTTVNANQCYVPKTMIDDLNLSATVFTLDFDNAYTSVDAATNSGIDMNTDAYDLQGHKILHKQKGRIYVIDGKVVRY